MGDWDAFEEDIPADEEEREVVVPVERRKRSQDARRFGGGSLGTSRGYSRRASLRGRVRPRPGAQTKWARPNPKPKQKLPHMSTVKTKDGKQVDINNNQAYVSSMIPRGAIPNRHLLIKEGQILFLINPRLNGQN